MTRMEWAKVTSVPIAYFLYAQANLDPADPSWVRLIESFGLPVALVIFFVWQWYLDKQRMGHRITALEKFQEDVIMKDVEERATFRASMASFTEELKKRPCLVSECAKK